MVGLGNVDNIATTAQGCRFCNNSWKCCWATNNYFCIRGSPSIHFIDTDNASQSRWVHHKWFYRVLNATSNWSLRCGDGEAQFYGTVTAKFGPAQVDWTNTN
jgi:hypothetical protein